MNSQEDVIELQPIPPGVPAEDDESLFQKLGQCETNPNFRDIPRVGGPLPERHGNRGHKLHPLYKNKIDPNTGKEVPHVAEHPQRNSPCPCGSGKKYKKCCG
jgi:preprotein translocase subunit SecA